MKEAIKRKTGLSEVRYRELVFEIIKQGLIAVAGLVVSSGTVFGSLRPFGLAFLAAVPNEYLALSSFGCFFGYIFPIDALASFRYFAAMFAIIAIKVLLSAVLKKTLRPLWTALICLATTLLTGLVITSGAAREMLLSVSEAVLAMGGAYFFAFAFKTLTVRKEGLSGEELASVLISDSPITAFSAS
jgi:hypothetical protein